MKVTDKLKEKIRRAITGVIYTSDAKPRTLYTDGSPLDEKLAMIERGTNEIVSHLEKDNSNELLSRALGKLIDWRPDEVEDPELDELIEEIKKVV